ncbi:serine/threonine-protein kinase PLK4 [Musca domestica]|uniref:Serine/threonine-protein kinase PLK4 n=1 Tax=Musca domestica TaxID=7370 RepID=A0A9J7D0L6_MUSDO|nr:serine/threonine-protein kinase PLK4 [Musca domestica]
MNHQRNWGENINEYEVLHLLGKGGFASVYKARCLRSNQYVAIKMIDKKLIHGAAMADRVRQEVEIHSRLKHPSVLELYTFFQDEHYVYLVLELAHNGELQRYMKSIMGRPMTEGEAAAILKQVVAGLLYLHSHSIMHRDISLSNLLLSKDMHIKIADFGLATQLKQPNERHVTMCGTPNYISPEVVSRSSHGLPADVWGLGCMFYTLLVGQPPFDTDAVQATLNRVVMSDYQIPSHISFDAKDLIKQLLRKKPEERISLQQVLKHPFMLRFSKETVTNTENRMDIGNSTRSQFSCDSGIITFSSSNASNSCPSFPKSNVTEQLPFASQPSNQHPLAPVDFQNRVSVKCSTNGNVERMKTEPFGEENWNWIRPNCPTTRSSNMQAIYGMSISDNCSGQTSLQAKSCEPERPLTVPPLNTTRLQPTRYKTKNAIMSILKRGEVVIEFIKYRAKYNADRVTDICWISGDGQSVMVYQPDSGRGLPVSDRAPDPPPTSSNCIFSYDTLPAKHHKKYAYAARFVNLVKSKTPKITYYSPLAKFALMESLEDFEAAFYDGSKVTKSPGEGIKVFDKHGRHLTQADETQALIDHQQACLNHCKAISKALELAELPGGHSCFPVVIGRRPTSDLQAQHVTTNKRDTNNIFSSTPKSNQVPSINFSLSVNPNIDFEGTSKECQQEFIASQPNLPIKRVNIPGIGMATELSHGVIQIQFQDHSVISVIPASQGGGITYTHSSGVSTHFGPHDDLPLQVREKILHLPTIDRMLKQSTDSLSRNYQRPHHPLYNGIVTSTPSTTTKQHMKFF